MRRSAILHAVPILLALLAPLPAQAQQDAAPLWAALAAGGHVVLIRHAYAPGNGDPPGFRLGECATQRNLNDEGRAQARAIGQALRRHGVAVRLVRSSRWCRCLETARLLDLGEVEPWPALDSLYGERRVHEPGQTAQLRALVSEPPAAGAGVLVLVTHQTNILALTGVGAGSGELVVLRPLGAGRFTVLGRIATR